jgi:hypothetical protein
MNIFYKKTISILLLALYFSLLISKEEAHNIQDELPKGFAHEYLFNSAANVTSFALSASTFTGSDLI